MNLNLARTFSCFAALSTLATAFLTADLADAALLAFDDFNYSPVGSDLNGNSGGGSFGFSDAWTGNTSINIGNGSLVSPTGWPIAQGNSTTTVAYQENRDINRTLATPLGADNTTIYISFLLRPEGVLNQGYANGWFALALRGSTHVFGGMIYPTNRYGLTVGFEDSLSNQVAVVGQTKLLVMRIDFTEGIDPTRLYLNPVGDEPAIPNAHIAVGSFNNITTISLTGPGAYSFDRLAIGTTWADVMPVPEPSTCLLGVFALLGLFVMRRR